MCQERQQVLGSEIHLFSTYVLSLYNCQTLLLVLGTQLPALMELTFLGGKHTSHENAPLPSLSSNLWEMFVISGKNNERQQPFWLRTQALELQSHGVSFWSAIYLLTWSWAIYLNYLSLRPFIYETGILMLITKDYEMPMRWHRKKKEKDYTSERDRETESVTEKHNYRVTNTETEVQTRRLSKGQRRKGTQIKRHRKLQGGTGSYRERNTHWETPETEGDPRWPHSHCRNQCWQEVFWVKRRLKFKKGK